MTDGKNGSGTGSLPRNRYREGQVLRARDLERETDYFLARDRQHNALAHGPGVLIGLQLVAYKAGTETPITEAELAQSGAQPLDLYVTRGAAIDWAGRLIILSKRVPVRPELATMPSVLDPGMYRLELTSEYDSTGQGPPNGSICETELNGVLKEGYELRLTPYDPNAPEPELDVGAVLEKPVDDTGVPVPIILGLVEWSGAKYVGYSTVLRPYASVRGQRIRAADDRVEVELRDKNNRLAVRFADMPAPGSPDPFTPGTMQDRFRIDSNGAVWLPTEISVGRTGVRFRREGDPNNPEDSKWRALTSTSASGADMGLDAQGQTLAPGMYAEGSRELRVLFQREGGNTGKNRVLIGHVDQNDQDFQPALVVYDRSPQAGGTGTVTVEIWGDLYVRGTAWLNAAARRPPTPGTGMDELDVLLRQLAGPFAGAFRAFLTSDPTWLQQFAGVMAKQVAAPGPVRTAFVTALVNDPTFVGAVTAALVAQAVAQAVPQAVAAVQSPANLPGLVAALLGNAAFTSAMATGAVAAVQTPANLNALLSAVAALLDIPGFNPGPLPADVGARVLAALYRRLIHNNPTLKNQITASVANNAAELNAFQTALIWLP